MTDAGFVAHPFGDAREDGYLEFTVAGLPAPQGSKVRTRYGMREDNASTRPWREAVAWEATAAMKGEGPLTGPLELSVTFVFPRPKSHYRTGKNAYTVKDNAPSFHIVRPDTDKLLRAIGDALTNAGAVVDDSQFAVVCAEKVYGSRARAVVAVRQVTYDSERSERASQAREGAGRASEGGSGSGTAT